MMAAWAILAPIAILSATLRKCGCCKCILAKTGLPCEDGAKETWFHIHRVFNMLAVILTIIGICIAYAMVEESDGVEHYSFGHAHWGLAILILCITNPILGIWFKPAKTG